MTIFFFLFKRNRKNVIALSLPIKNRINFNYENQNHCRGKYNSLVNKNQVCFHSIFLAI